MKFERIVPIDIEGATLFGHSLNALHSKKIDREGLREWVEVFANLIPGTIGPTLYSDDTPFCDAFKLDLAHFCMYIANSDGRVSEEEIAAITWLLGLGSLSTRTVESIKEAVNGPEWAKYYPISFQWIVADLGQSEDINTVAQAPYFYRQVARYIYSIDNDGDFGDDNGAADYVVALFKYVERVSVTGFFSTEGELTIAEVCATWDRLVDDERNGMKRDVCGTWRAISGNALFNGGLSDLVLLEDGQGYMVRKKLFGQKRLDVSWEVTELPGMSTQTPVVAIPDLKASAVMLMLDADRMVATVYSNDPRLRGKTAVYQRT